MESEDMEEIMGEPVWKVEDRDLGMMDLEKNGHVDRMRHQH